MCDCGKEDAESFQFFVFSGNLNPAGTPEVMPARGMQVCLDHLHTSSAAAEQYETVSAGLQISAAEQFRARMRVVSDSLSIGPSFSELPIDSDIW